MANGQTNSVGENTAQAGFNQEFGTMPGDFDDDITQESYPFSNWVQQLTEDHKEHLILQLMRTLSVIRKERDHAVHQLNSSQSAQRILQEIGTMAGMYSLYSSGASVKKNEREDTPSLGKDGKSFKK